MSFETRNELKRERERIRPAAEKIRKESGRISVYDEEGKGSSERLFPDLHVRIFGRENGEGPDTDRHVRLPDGNIRRQLAETVCETDRYLEPEKRTGNSLLNIHAKVSELDRSLSELSGTGDGMFADLQILHESVQKKKKQLERIDGRNVPVNPAALRTFGEVGAGIEKLDAYDLLVSDLFEKAGGVLTGQQVKADGMSTEDLENIVNETGAMEDRHRYTKEQQSLHETEQEYLGTVIDQPNRVVQEASEIKKGSHVRRREDDREESAELFEKRKGEKERDALHIKHDILKRVSQDNRNNLHQKLEKDGLEAVRSMMYNGDRNRGFAPLSAMGLGGNLYKGFAGTNYLLSMTPQAAEKDKKISEIREIMNRYLGLDQLYRNFMTKNSDIRNRTAFLKRYGTEGNVRVMIRKEQDKALGKGSENRMNTLIMKKYAEELWKGAFLKNDGAVITERERQKEDPAKREKRKLYADMLRAMGFDIRYPDAEGERTGIRAVDIWRRLLP